METTHRHPVKNRLHSWLLERGEAYMHRKYGPRKKAIFSRLPPSVVEIGSGPAPICAIIHPAHGSRPSNPMRPCTARCAPMPPAGASI